MLQGLAKDGGLFVPEEIPKLPTSWKEDWKDLSFEQLAYEIASLYISPSEIPSEDLKDIVKRSYATFRHPERTPLVDLESSQDPFILELFHGPTFAFKGATKLYALYVSQFGLIWDIL